jgi:hypothetical protein
MPSRRRKKGLGDTIDAITTATGIKALVKAVAPDCGCEKRREKLNQIFPYYREMSPEDIELFKPFLDWRTRFELKVSEVRTIFEIYRRVTGRYQEYTRCASCIQNALKTLDEVYHLSCASLEAETEPEQPAGAEGPEVQTTGQELGGPALDA